MTASIMQFNQLVIYWSNIIHYNNKPKGHMQLVELHYARARV